MQYSIIPTDTGCALVVKDHHTTNTFPIAEELLLVQHALHSLLIDANLSDVRTESQAVIWSRTKTGVTCHHNGHEFAVAYPHAYGLLLGLPT